MLISVVIPVFNRRESIGRAIDSVLGQTLQPDEVIVVDDASTDGTAAFVRQHYPDVVVLRNPGNCGVSHSRNRGVDAARGDWIAFLDSDDEWLPAKLSRQREALGPEGDAPLCHTDEIWIRRGVRVNPRRRHEKRGGDIFEHCLPLCVISPSAALVRRDLLVELGGFDESLPACEDYDLWLRLCAHHRVCFVPEPLLVKYGGHDDQLSRKYWGMDRFRVAALEKMLADERLSQARRRAVLEVMIEKLDILHAGAVKRGRGSHAADWRRRRDAARDLLRGALA